MVSCADNWVLFLLDSIHLLLVFIVIIGLILIFVICHQQRKGQKHLYLQKIYVIFFFSVHLHLSFLGLPEIKARVYIYLVLLFLHVLSLQIYLQTYKCMLIDIPLNISVCTCIIIHVYTQNHTSSEIYNWTLFLVLASHFILESFSIKWPFIISLNSSCMRLSLCYQVVPASGTLVIVREHLLNRTLPPATPTSSSWHALCSRTQEGHSPSFSCPTGRVSLTPPGWGLEFQHTKFGGDTNIQPIAASNSQNK